MTSSKGHLQVLRNIIWHSSEKILRMLIGFFVGLWLARYFGPEQFGRFNYIVAWLGMFEAIAWLGVGDNMLRDIVRNRDDEDLIMGSAFLIRLCGSLLAVSLTLLAAKPLGGFDNTDLGLLAVLCIGLPFSMTTGGVWIWFASHTNIGPAVLTKNVSMFVGGVLRVAVILTGAGLLALIGAVVAESLLWWLLLVIAYLRYGEHFLRWRYDFRHAWRMLLTGLPIILNALVVSLNARVDQIMLGRLTTMSDVGVYAAAMRFSEIWWVVPPMIVQALSSRYIFAPEVGDFLKRNVARITAAMAILSLLPCLLISGLGGEVVGLFLGEEYLGAADVLTIHIWTAVLIFIDVPISQYLLATYRQSQLVLKSTVLLLCNFGLAFYLVPQYGAAGAAMATLLAQALTVLVLPVAYSPMRDVSSVYLLAIREVLPMSRILYRMVASKLLARLPDHLVSTWLNWRSVGLLLVVGVCSVAMGLLAVTADPVKIGLGISLMLGSVLLVKPEWTVWLIFVIGLLFGVLSASAAFSKITWGVSLLSMLLFIPSFMNIVWSEERRAPGFIWLALAYFFYATVVSAVQCDSLMEFVAGFKRYFQAFGLMMALTMIVFTTACYDRWLKFLMVVALLQFPFALYELLVLVPQRGGFELSSYTTDVIAGTFGANLEGGSPNFVMVVYLFVALAFLLARWRAGLIKSSTFYIFSLICLAPLGMGETKIAVLMVPLVGMVVMQNDLKKNPLSFLISLVVLLSLSGMLVYLYAAVMMNTSLDAVIDQTISYNFGEKSYNGEVGDLNRWTSITFWFQQQGLQDPVSFLFGNGLGSSYSALEGSAVPGHIGSRYLHLTLTVTAVSTILWDTGLVGLMLFIGIFIAAWVGAGKLMRAVDDPVVKADALAIQAGSVIFLLSLVYVDFIVNLVSMELLYAILLGYLGYLMNKHGVLTSRSAVSTSVQQFA